MPFGPYGRFWIKVFGVFVTSCGVTSGLNAAVGNPFAWFLFFWPGVLAVGYYFVGVADSTPAPWVTPEQAYAHADRLAMIVTPTPQQEDKKS